MYRINMTSHHLISLHIYIYTQRYTAITIQATSIRLLSSSGFCTWKLWGMSTSDLVRHCIQLWFQANDAWVKIKDLKGPTYAGMLWSFLLHVQVLYITILLFSTVLVKFHLFRDIKLWSMTFHDQKKHKRRRPASRWAPGLHACWRRVFPTWNLGDTVERWNRWWVQHGSTNPHLFQRWSNGSDVCPRLEVFVSHPSLGQNRLGGSTIDGLTVANKKTTHECRHPSKMP